VKRTLPEVIVDFLSFSRATRTVGERLVGFSQRAWERALPWLDDAGLALYFLQKVNAADCRDTLPESALQRLETNLSANHRRVAYMEQQFVSLNQKFNAAGVKYAAVKGLTLVPEFCPDASLRHQSDFDYLVEEPSLRLARRVLEGTGYSLHQRKGPELIFLMSSVGIRVGGSEQYEAQAPHTVELHRAMWDSEFHGLSLREPRFLKHTAAREFRGVPLYTLHEEDAFLLQAVHAFHHILTGWIKMSWLYEIGYFLNQRESDVLLWARLARNLRDDLLSGEVIALVTCLSAQFFQAPIPFPIESWVKELRPAVRVWIENYAQLWAFGKNRVDEFSLFPTGKLVLFLHEQYVADDRNRRNLILRRLVPVKRLARVARVIKARPSVVLESKFRTQERVVRRILFNLAAGMRYLWEIPRWRRLNGVSAKPAALHLRRSGASDPARL
jgi:hypothetical protein